MNGGPFDASPELEAQRVRFHLEVIEAGRSQFDEKAQRN